MSPAIQIGAWYALAVNTGQEKRIRERILDRLERGGVTPSGLKIVCPQQSVLSRGADGKRREVKKMTLPGYLLIYGRRIDERALQMMLRVQGTLSFIGGNDHPTPLTREEMESILGTAEKKIEEGVSGFKIDDIVEINSGPFSGFTGKVIEKLNPAQGTVTVEVEIFGRKTPAAVPVEHLKLR